MPIMYIVISRSRYICAYLISNPLAMTGRFRHVQLFEFVRATIRKPTCIIHAFNPDQMQGVESH